MKCPFCGLDNDKVIDSRGGEDGSTIRRRRRCLECQRRFTTYERVAEVDIKVVKKNGERHPFQPDKLRQGLERACWKRPVSVSRIDELVSQIEQEVYAAYDGEIDSQELGRIVMDHLMELDEVAYIRFASVYRQFTDVNDFVDELQPMLRRARR
jgi:transcriptional repressor NrdR